MSRKPDERADELSRLAAGIAHDLNNLLTAVTGRVDLLLLEQDTNSPLREELEEIKDDVRKTARIVSRLLEFTGQSPTRRRPTAVTELLEGIEEDVLRRREGEIRVFVTLEAGADQVHVDLDQIRRVIGALVDNALEAMPQEGLLMIRTRAVEVADPASDDEPELEAGGYVRLDVMDRGVGMAPDTLSRAFEPYFSTKGAGAGRGLQLAAARQIVLQNDGAIEIDSEPGKGTTVTLLLPTGGPEARSGRA